MNDLDLTALADARATTVRRAVRTVRDLRPGVVPERLAERTLRRDERAALLAARAGRDVCWTDEDDPLVTVRIATHGSARPVVERAVTSALAQTHRNVEVLVVGDGADEVLLDRVRAVGDPRVRVVNLPAPTVYPTRDRDRWLVAGWSPMNRALDEARGSWFAPCDDDDELTADHVEVLLDAARAQRVELVHSRTRVALGDGSWGVLGSSRLRRGHTTHGSVLYAGALRCFRYRGTSYRAGEPFDINLWRRMLAAGVRVGWTPAVTYHYFPLGPTLEAYRRLQALA